MVEVHLLTKRSLDPMTVENPGLESSDKLLSKEFSNSSF